MNDTTIPTLRDGCCVRRLGDETIFLAKNGAEVHTLDETGTSIWTMIEAGRSIGEMVAGLCDEYEVDSETARTDLLVFLEELAGKGLIDLPAGGR